MHRYSSFIFMVFIFCACHNKVSKETNYETDSLENNCEDGIVNYIYEEVTPALNIDLDIKKRDNSEEVSYNMNIKNDTIFITPTSEYYDAYSSPEELVLFPMRDVNYSDYIENPEFELYITNNGDKTISIDKIKVMVENSNLDDFPYIYLEQHFYDRYGMRLQNESWKNWGDMILEYSFPKRFESFTGEYDYKISIPYFQDYAYVDFRSHILTEGFDEGKLSSYLWDGLDEELMYPVYGKDANKNHIAFKGLDKEISTSILDELSQPFFYGYEMDDQPFIFARIHGKISFTKSKFTKKFTGIIPLTTVYPGGADNELVDEFEVELKPEGKDYYMNLPYITVLEEGDSERIKIKIKCQKSSHHKLKIKVFSQDEEIGTTKAINFYNLNGRHSSYHILKDW